MGRVYNRETGEMEWEREAYIQSARSIFDPVVRQLNEEQRQKTCKIYSAIILARRDAPRRATGHETD